MTNRGPLITLGSNANRSGTVTLRGSVTGSKIVLSGPSGAAVTATISGGAVFGTVTALGGQSLNQCHDGQSRY